MKGLIWFFVNIFALTMVSAYGQTYRQEKRIYLLDMTASMTGKGVVDTPDIFEDVKNQLISTIEDLQLDGPEIVIIPFTDKPHTPVLGFTNDKQSLINGIRSINIRPGDTNIADAWIPGVE